MGQDRPKYQPTCGACHHSKAVQYDLQKGGKTDWLLYCTFWEGHLYAACSQFVYEPGTDVTQPKRRVA